MSTFNLFNAKSSNLETHFGQSPSDYIEASIYNAINTKLVGIDKVSDYTALTPYSSGSVTVTPIILPIASHVENEGYIVGTYKLQYHFLRPQLGDKLNKFKIHAISADRNEIRVIPTDDASIQYQLDFGDFSQAHTVIPDNLIVNFGDQQYYDIIDFVRDDITFPDSPWSLIIKIDGTFDKSIDINDTAFICQRIANPYDATVTLTTEFEDEVPIKIRNTNFDYMDRYVYNNITAFKSQDDLTTFDSYTQSEILNYAISQSFGSDPMGIDYKSFANFIHFSSAANRLSNFRYKLRQLEYIQESIDSITTDLESLPESSSTGSAFFIQNVTSLQQDRNSILTSFDAYERHLYYSSASYETSSLGEFWPSTWPKTNAEAPYTLAATTSETAIDWYDGALSSASLYDSMNQNALMYFLPEYIRDDSANAEFVTFVNLLGHFYDILYNATTQLTSIYNPYDNRNVQWTPTYLSAILASAGLEVPSGMQLAELYQLYNIQFNRSQYNNELWKRLYNNMPYLLWSKGTVAGIRGLMNCYGVPPSVLRIKEYTGPKSYYAARDDGYDWNTNLNDYNVEDKFQYAIGFQANKHASTSSLGELIFRTTESIDRVSFRFKPIQIDNQPTSYTNFVKFEDDEGDPSVNCSIINIVSGSIYADIKVESEDSFVTPVTLTNVPIFNGLWWVATLEATYQGGTLYLTCTNKGQDINDPEVFNSEAMLDDSFFPNSTDPHPNIGYHVMINQSASFYGYVQAFKCYKQTETAGSISALTYARQFEANAPDSHLDPTFAELYHWFPLGAEGGVPYLTGSSASIIRNQGLIQSYPVITSNTYNAITINGSIVTESFTDKSYKWWPLELGSRWAGDRIIVHTSSLHDNILSSTRSNQDIAKYYATNNSHRLDITFSPQDEINEDIAQSYGYFENVSSWIGDPRYQYSESYAALDIVKSTFSKARMSNGYNWNDYIKPLRVYDGALFHLIKQSVPLRSKSRVGLVIAPTIFERTRIPLTKLEPPSSLNHDSEIDCLVDSTLTGINELYQAAIIYQTESLSSTYNSTIAQINAIPDLTVASIWNYSDTTINATTASLIANASQLQGQYQYNNVHPYQYHLGSNAYYNLYADLHDRIANDGIFVDEAINYDRAIRYITVDGINLVPTSPTWLSGSYIDPTEIIDYLNEAIGYEILRMGDKDGYPYDVTYVDNLPTNSIFGSISIRLFDPSDHGTRTEYSCSISGSTFLTNPIWKYDGVYEPIDQSRLSELRQIKRYAYTSSLDIALGRPVSWSYDYARVSDVNLDSTARTLNSYEGCKMTAKDFNQNSTDTIDGGPVITIIAVDDSVLHVNNSNTSEGYIKIS